MDALRIWRYEDPVLGPRKIPVCSEPFMGKVQLENGTFSIDVDKNEVFLATETAKSSIGTTFIYVVE